MTVLLKRELRLVHRAKNLPSLRLTIGSVVLFGYIGDRISSRRLPFISGLILVFLSTLCFALATSLWVLLMARLIEGFSTAAVNTVGYTLLTETVGRKNLGKAMGYTSLAISFGLLIGPVIGGVLYEYCGYFQVFLPAFGLIGTEVVLRLLIIEKDKPAMICIPPAADDTNERFSFPGKDRNSENEDNSPVTTPLLPRQATTRFSRNAYGELLSSPRFLTSLIAIFILNSIICGFDSTLVPYIHDTFAMRATHAAALFFALAIPMVLTPIFGYFTDRYGPRLPVITGLMLATPSLSLLPLIKHSTVAPFPKLAAVLVCVGLAFALALPPTRVEAMLVVGEMEDQWPGEFGSNSVSGRANGLINMMVAAGGMVGPLYAGYVRVKGGWEVLAWCNAGWSLGLLMLVILITGRKSGVVP